MKEGKLVASTEEVVGWRTLSQQEVDEFWMTLHGKLRVKSWTSGRWRTAKEKPRKGEVRPGVETRTKKQEIPATQMDRRLLGKNLVLVQRVQSTATGKHA